MKGLVRIAAVICVGAMSVVAAPALAAHASSKVTLNVYGTPSGGYDFLKGCNGPGDCYTDAGALDLTILASNLNQPITVGYKTVDGTALAGRDYVATSGNVTIQPDSPQAFVTIPLIINGDPPGSTLQFTAKITSTSLPATISGSPAPEIIDTGGNFPWGCNLSQANSSSVSAACTGQPATLQWEIGTECYITKGVVESQDGNVVTGNGTSTATCPNSERSIGQGYDVVS
jgi:hypothetical protein